MPRFMNRTASARPRTRNRSNTAFSAVNTNDQGPAYNGRIPIPYGSNNADRESSRDHSPTRDGLSHTPASQDFGWTELADKLDDHDEETIKGCNDDIDTLLVFAGLFSGVLTAFVVQLYTNLQPDPETTSAEYLQRISHQLDSFTLSPPYINSTQSSPSAPLPPFQTPASAVRINILWFLSLVISLVVASLSMLVKQWLRQYRIKTCTSPEERIRIRHFRYEGLVQWGVFEISAALPLLLQLALVLFFIGLSDFLRSLSPVVGWIVTVPIVLWLLLFTAGTLAPMIYPQCPYATPFLTPLARVARSTMWRLKASKDGLGKYYEFPGDEMGVRRDAELDVPALIHADRVFRDDSIVGDILLRCLPRFKGSDIIEFTKHMLSHRLHNPIKSLIPGKDSHILDFRRLHTRAVSNSMRILLSAVHSAITTATKATEEVSIFHEPWVHEALCYIFATLDHCAQVNREIGIHFSHRQIVDLHSSMLSGNDSHAIQLWVKLRMQYPTIPLEPGRYSLKLEVIGTILSIAEELSNDGSYQPIFLLQVVLELTVAVVQSQSRDSAVLANLQGTLDRFVAFIKKTVEVPASSVSSQEPTQEAIHRLSQSIAALKIIIARSPSPKTLKGLVQALNRIHATFVAPPRHGLRPPTLSSSSTVEKLADSPSERGIQLPIASYSRKSTPSSSTEAVPVTFFDAHAAATMGARTPDAESPSWTPDSLSVRSASTEHDFPNDDFSPRTVDQATYLHSDASLRSFEITVQPPSEPSSPEAPFEADASIFLSPNRPPPPLPIMEPSSRSSSPSGSSTTSHSWNTAEGGTPPLDTPKRLTLPLPEFITYPGIPHVSDRSFDYVVITPPVSSDTLAASASQPARRALSRGASINPRDGLYLPHDFDIFNHDIPTAVQSEQLHLASIAEGNEDGPNRDTMYFTDSPESGGTQHRHSLLSASSDHRVQNPFDDNDPSTPRTQGRGDTMGIPVDAERQYDRKLDGLSALRGLRNITN